MLPSLLAIGLLLDVIPSTGGSGTASSGGTESTGSSGSTGATTETMPPVYEPCGCRGAGEGGAWGLLALALTAGAPSRRRRPTTPRPCSRAA